MSSFICQLKTHFSCSCVNCLGFDQVQDYHHQQNQNQQKLFSNFTESPSFTSESYYIATESYLQQCSEEIQSSSSSSSNHQQLGLEFTESVSTSLTGSIVSSASSSSTGARLEYDHNVDDDDDEYETEMSLSFHLPASICIQLQEQEQKIRDDIVLNYEADYCDLFLPQLILIQRKQHFQKKSFLQVAQSIKRSQRRCCIELSQKAVVEKPKCLVFDIKLHPRYQEQHQKFLVKQYKKYRFNQKATRQRLVKLNLPHMPYWLCDGENTNSQRSLREICVTATGEFDAVTNEPEFLVYERRLTTDHLRLPYTTAIANRIRREWIIKNRVFSGKTPFSQEVQVFADDSKNSTSTWESIPAIDHKQDTRGERNFAARTRFNGKDDSQRCNRNFGRCRNAARNNGWNEGRKWDIGNSKKDIFGKPWLHSRRRKIFRRRGEHYDD